LLKRFRECLNVDIGGAGIESFTVPISLVLEMAYNTKSIVWMYIESIHLLLCLSTVHMTQLLTSPELGKESAGAGEGAVREAPGLEGAERVRVAVVAGHRVWSGVERVDQQGRRRGRGRMRGECGGGKGLREALGSVLGAWGAHAEKVGAARKASGLGLRAHAWRGLGQGGRRRGWGLGAHAERVRAVDQNAQFHPIRSHTQSLAAGFSVLGEATSSW